jgi:hypothetical protein
VLPENHDLGAGLGKHRQFLAVDLDGLGAGHQGGLLLRRHGEHQLQALAVAGADDAPGVCGVGLTAVALAEGGGGGAVDVDTYMARVGANVPADALRRGGLQLVNAQPRVLGPTIAY